MIDDWFYRTAPNSAGRCSSGERRQDALCLLHLQLRLDAARSQGRRVGFEGVSIMSLRDGKIAEYREVANVAPGFVQMGFAPERIAKILASEGEELKARPEMKRHLAE